MKKRLFILAILAAMFTGVQAREHPAQKTDLGLSILKSREPVRFLPASSGYNSVKEFLDLTGFVETRLGIRTQNDPHEKNMSIGEFRLQLETEKEFGPFALNVVADFLLDPVLDVYAVDLNKGEGVIDLRQANIAFTPLAFMDVKIGRQILTWGTGDLVFINDLFAKDWNAFLAGRADEYLKAPTDAIKSSLFFDAVNIDFIYVPKFGADRFIDGKRISFFDRSSNSLQGRNNPVVVNRPNDWFEDDELSARFYRSFGVYEAAFYYYNGYWKSPAGLDILSGNATFPELEVFGASLRSPVANGIGNVEAGYYNGANGAATNPLIRNSEFRFLAGYEREIATELTASVQYNLERKLDYEDYAHSLPGGALRDDENRHVLTLRLTKLMQQQDLRLSLFNFYSPSDKDGFLRLNASYKFSDSIKIEGGANFFYGKEDHTFFAQFQNNSGVFAAMRYEF